MSTEVEILLTNKIDGLYEGSRQEIAWNMQADRVKIYSRVKTYLTDKKARRFTVLGLDYWFLFKDGKLYYKINSQEFNYYLGRLSQTNPDVTLDGWQVFKLKQTGKWQSIEINTINYDDRKVYSLLILVKY